MFHTGKQIGPYTLIRKIGSGGFGEVWLAERRTKFVTTKVAIKLPLDEQVDHEAIKQEATLWERASGHSNVLPIIDADEYDGQIVIVSEYAPDGSLEAWLKANGIMPLEQAIETTIQILNGLEFLHFRNIIHRDLKPANILLQGMNPRLADFGISRALRTTAASQSQHISGTFAYMSPEALDGKRSVQTDVWSVGVNLYQILSGTLPFPQKEPSALFPAIIMREFVPLPDSIPQNLRNIVAKALAKLPEERYKTASEMREDLRRTLRDSVSSHNIQPDLPKTQESFSPPPVLLTQKVSVDSTSNAQDETATIVRPILTYDEKESRKNFNGWIYGAIALSVLGVFGMGVFLLSNQSGQKSSAENKPNEISQTLPNNSFAKPENVNVSISPENANASVSRENVNAPISIDSKTNSTTTALVKNSNSAAEKPLPQIKDSSTEDDFPTTSTGRSSGGTGFVEDEPEIKKPPVEQPPLPKPNKPISKGVVNGSATSLPKPPYPAAARAVRASGAVNVQVLIDENGNVISASAVSGHPLLRQASEQAARAAKFRPTLLSGQAVKVNGIVVYNFVP